MKKSVNPSIAAVLVVVAVLIIGFIFYKQTTPPEPVKGDPLGLDDMPKGSRGKGMTPDIQSTIQQRQGNQGGK